MDLLTDFSKNKKIAYKKIVSTEIAHFAKYLYSLFNYVEILPFGAYDMKIKIKSNYTIDNVSKVVNEYMSMYKTF